MSKNALILSGGGARASYQVGVLLAVSDILPHLSNPFPIICGTSAGAINALAMAAHPGSYRQAARSLESHWDRLRIEQIYRTEWQALIGSLTKVGASLFNNGIARGKPLGLLDNAPLRELLTGIIPFDNIDRRIRKGYLDAVSVTALGYASGESVSFFQGKDSLRGWRRSRRVGTPSKITVDHLLASSAIPTVFPAVYLSKEYFGDGAMRQLAPVSTALHLGADRVFVIGVSTNRNPNRWTKPIPSVKHPPSVAQIFGQMFNSAFIDSLEGDLEHLERVNALLDLLEEQESVERCENTRLLRPVETLIISPSKSLDTLAGNNVEFLPKPIRAVLRTTGATARAGGASVASYLLFAHQYCRELMDLGYQDAMWEKDAIKQFFTSPKDSGTTDN